MTGSSVEQKVGQRVRNALGTHRGVIVAKPDVWREKRLPLGGVAVRWDDGGVTWSDPEFLLPEAVSD